VLIGLQMARHSYYKLAQICYLLLNNHLAKIVNPSIEGAGLVPGLEISARLHTYLHTPLRGDKTCRFILFTQLPATQHLFRTELAKKVARSRPINDSWASEL